MIKKHPRIIYFIKGAAPTADDLAGALKLGANVVFRNVQFIGQPNCLEACAGVAGAVPPAYANCADGAEVIAEFNASIGVDAPAAIPPIPEVPAVPPVPEVNDGWGAVPPAPPIV